MLLMLSIQMCRLQVPIVVYGATQGIFAVESVVNELAHKMGMDPVKVKEMNMPVEGGPLPGYPDVPYAQSCSMDRCMARARDDGLGSKYPCRDMGNGKVRGVGVAMAMQGSSIAGVDVGGADIKLNEDGSYTLALGCTDMEQAVIPLWRRLRLTV